MYQPLNVKPDLLGDGRVTEDPAFTVADVGETVPPLALYVTVYCGLLTVKPAVAVALPTEFVAVTTTLQAIAEPFCAIVGVNVVPLATGVQLKLLFIHCQEYANVIGAVPLQPDVEAVKVVDPAVPLVGETKAVPPDGATAGAVNVTDPDPAVSVVLFVAVIEDDEFKDDEFPV